MIRLVKYPKPKTDSAEGIRIYENRKVYGDIALFWHQDGGKAVISMLDGDMIISGKPTDYLELSEFIRVLSPRSIFSNTEILKGLNILENSLIVSVLSRTDFNNFRKTSSDTLSSKDVYRLLSSVGFELPDYPGFATDYCHRLNRGRLRYFAVKDIAVALCISNKNVLINGLVSRKSNYGSICLNGLLSDVKPKKAFVCAPLEVEGFYIKNGFKKIYEAGYWRK